MQKVSEIVYMIMLGVVQRAVDVWTKIGMSIN